MIETFVEELATRLAELGVEGRAARRVLAETEDHLRAATAVHGDDEAVRRFGPADRMAPMVAAELATSETRTAAYDTFGALAVAGAGLTIALLLVPAAGGWTDIFGGHVPALGVIAAVGMVVLAQLAFVAGCLALLRAVRLRRAPSVSAVELRLLRRRSAVALAAGGGALAALAAYALDSSAELAGWWTWSTVAFCIGAATLLGGAATHVARSARPAARSGGEEGDVFDDLALLLRSELIRRLALPEHPWRFASLTAAAVGLAGFAAGWYAEGDPGSGLVRGAFEALALLACFAVLGRTLGLRRSAATDKTWIGQARR